MSKRTPDNCQYIKRKPMLKNYVARYGMDKYLLEKHPEQTELLLRRIEEHKCKIIEYVTSDSFKEELNYLNL